MQLACLCDNRQCGILIGKKPGLKIAGLPEKTVSLVLIAINPDTEKFHWVVYNIPRTDTIEEDLKRGNNAVNDFFQHDFMGIASSGKKSRLIFFIFAIDSVLTIGGGKGGNDILKAINGHILDYATTECRYTNCATLIINNSPLESHHQPHRQHDRTFKV